MTDEIEENSEQENPAGETRNLYDKYALSAEENDRQPAWRDKLAEANAEDLANFYANEGGDPTQVVFYLEKTGLDEKEKWEILAQNFEARADFAHQQADETSDEKEKEKLIETLK